MVIQNINRFISRKSRLYLNNIAKFYCNTNNFLLTVTMDNKRTFEKGETSCNENKKQKLADELLVNNVSYKTDEIFLNKIKELYMEDMYELGESFSINKNRYCILSDCKIIKNNSVGIIYWMSRDCRVQDNWALLYAQQLSIINKIPLYICFFNEPKDLYKRKMHHVFLIEGLKEIEKELSKLNIKFYILNVKPDALIDIIIENNIGALICELYPLKEPTKWQNYIKQKLPPDILFVKVDAHNIVPVWVTSNKLETAARTIRPKLLSNFDDYFEYFPIVSTNRYNGNLILHDMDITFDEAMNSYPIGNDIYKNYKWAIGGRTPGLCILNNFVKEKLQFYDNNSSDPSKNAISNLSPWLRFGQISAHICAAIIKKYENKYPKSVKKFLEELIIRKELTDNFCYYNSDNYDNISGASIWAQETLNKHQKDKRSYIYSKEDFENAKTHDNYWNAAQLQLLKEGKIHGYMRMYWAKKILEWTESPKSALEIVIYLNDTYSLDGSDPNGYVGVMWSICGVHDLGWKERPIFGKIRYMNDKGLERKFNIKKYCELYL